MSAVGNAAADVQAVVFGLGEETFALPVGTVREILDHRDAFRVPNGPEWLLGLADVRGESVPMVDLRVRLGMAVAATTLATRILVVDAALGDRVLTLGLVVDRVLDVSVFTPADVEDVPDIGIRWQSDYIQGVVRRQGGFILLLNLTRVVAAEDGFMLSSLDSAA